MSVQKSTSIAIFKCSFKDFFIPVDYAFSALEMILSFYGLHKYTY